MIDRHQFHSLKQLASLILLVILLCGIATLYYTTTHAEAQTAHAPVLITQKELGRYTFSISPVPRNTFDTAPLIAVAYEQSQKASELFPTPTSLPTSTPTPTQIPTPTPTAAPVVLSASTQQSPPPGSLSADVLFDLINQHRQSIGLPPYEKEANLCALAASRAPELYNEIYVTHNIHAGFYARNLPYWITENMISQPTEQAAFNWWMGSYIHRKAIEATHYKYACGACSGTSCTMLFTSYEKK